MAINKRIIRSNDEAAVGASFNTVLYTGNGSTQSITGVGFEPDMVWLKVRNTVNQHFVVDDVRGNFYLKTNDTAAETAVSGFSGFTSDGFDFSLGGALYNGSGLNYVAWCWKAGGAAVTNTDGTITSQVSANVEAGFSVVSYTGNQTNATVGHGLGVAPKVVIAKGRSYVQNWAVYHYDIGTGKWLQLNTTNAAITENIFGGVHPNSSTFSLNGNVVVNKSGGTNIAYCFAEVAGFSKFGSYVGGTANNSITLGFEPAFIMIKSYSGVAEQWAMYDNKRSPTNPVNDIIYAQSSAAESVNNTNQEISFDANGFTLIDTNSLTNLSGSSYIYMAFANQF